MMDILSKGRIQLRVDGFVGAIAFFNSPNGELFYTANDHDRYIDTIQMPVN